MAQENEERLKAIVAIGESVIRECETGDEPEEIAERCARRLDALSAEWGAGEATA